MLLDGELRGKISDFGRSRDVRELFKPFQASVRGMVRLHSLMYCGPILACSDQEKRLTKRHHSLI